MPAKTTSSGKARPASRDDTKYLQRRGKVWYARIIVPPSVRDVIGTTHLKVSLKTTDLAEANVSKLLAVYEMKQEIERARRGVDWKDWREAIRKAKDPYERELLRDFAVDWAEKKAEMVGEEEAICQLAKALNTDPMLSELVSQFLGRKELSTDTKRKHSRALQDLTAFFTDDPSPAQISASRLLEFTDSLIEAKLAPNTKRDRLSSLGTFWDWLERRLHTPRGTNPFRGITVKGGTVEDSRAFTEDEVKQILDSKFSEQWQKVAFTVLLLTGARPNEVLGLRHEDVDLQAQTIRITSSKTDAGVRTLPYRHPALVSVFKSLYRDKAAPSERVFPVDPTTDKPAKNFINYFSRHKVRNNLAADVSLYSTRKTFISKALDLGLDLVNVERYIGHKNQRLALSVYSKGRSDSGLVDVAEGIGSGWPQQL